MSLSRRCPEYRAKTMTRMLLGEEEAVLPYSGTPVYTYFAEMSLRRAIDAFGELYELPEGYRVRDLSERMGEDVISGV